MDVLRALHNWQFHSAFAALFPTPLALVTLALFVWSLVFLARPAVPRGVVWLLRASWALFLLPAVTGVILAVLGQKVASAVPGPREVVAQRCQDVPQALTAYCFPPDPSRNWEHWMYAGLALLSLLAAQALVGGKLFERERGLKYLPVVTLFLFGVAFMTWRVAIFPGSTPGT